MNQTGNRQAYNLLSNVYHSGLLGYFAGCLGTVAFLSDKDVFVLW